MNQQFCGNCVARAWRHCRLLLATVGLAGIVGCAGGAWLGSPADVDLPLDHVRPYPTAVVTDLEEPAQSQQATAASAAAKPKPEDKHPPLPATTLAAVPPHLRQQQAPPKPIPLVTQANSGPIPINLPPQAAVAPAPPPSAAGQVLPTAQAPPVAQAPTPTTVPLAAGPNVVQPLPASALAAAAVASHLPPATTTPSASATPVGNAGATVAAGESRQASIDAARSELIAALEAEIRDRRTRSATDDELPRLEQQLRLLYLAANRLDDAVASVESLDQPQREGFKHAMFGLGVWMSPDEAKRAPLRSAKVLRSLREATTELAAASKLELKTIVFCERVEQFGWYTEFSRNEFRPKQQVILYVEVENFAAEKKGSSFETELQGSYQIFDEGGRIVAERQLPLDRETCRNFRRDYFLAYPMYLPETIEPGRYRLELTVEDLKANGDYQGRKFGEGMIEFTIRQ